MPAFYQDGLDKAKAFTPRPAGSTPTRLFFYVLYAIGIFFFISGLADTVIKSAEVQTTVEMEVRETLEFPTIFMCAPKAIIEAKWDADLKKHFSAGSTASNNSVYFKHCDSKDSCKSTTRNSKNDPTNFTKYAECEGGYAWHVKGQFPRSSKGDCKHLFTPSQHSDATFLSDVFSATQDDNAKMVCVVINPSAPGEKKKIVDGVETGSGTAVDLKDVKLEGTTRANPRQLIVPMTLKHFVPDKGGFGVVGFYPRGKSPTVCPKKPSCKYDADGTDDCPEHCKMNAAISSRNLVKEAQYITVPFQRMTSLQSLWLEEDVDQTKVYKLTGKPGKKEGTLTQRWRASSTAGPATVKVHKSGSDNTAGDITPGEYPVQYFVFSIDDFTVRRTYNYRPSVSTVLNEIGSAFALSMLIVSMFYRQQTAANSDGDTAAYQVFRFKSMQEAQKEAKKLFIARMKQEVKEAVKESGVAADAKEAVKGEVQDAVAGAKTQI